MKNAIIVGTVHTHTHTCNLIKEKINALLYAFNNNIHINVEAGFMPALTDKYKMGEI